MNGKVTVTNDELSLRHNAFVADLLVHGDQSLAYRNAFDCSGMNEKTISSGASKLVKQPHIATAIANHKQTVVDRAMLSVVEVMQEFVDIVTADVTKLMQWRKHCCRHCHGVDFHYQWRSVDEWCTAVIDTQRRNAKATKAAPQEMPNDAGGYGYNPKKPPHDDCPHCMGDGFGYVWLADTRKLTGKEKKLFAGIKQTPNGVQILTRDQDTALKNLAQIMGLFVDRVQIGGEGGGPVVGMQLPNDPVEASRVYQTFIKQRNANT